MAHFFDMSRKAPAGELTDLSGGGGGRRERTLQRLQIGGTGVLLMMLLVGLASVIDDRATLTDATAVPEAAPTTEPTQAAQQNDPLVEAGVVPDLPAQPSAEPEASPTPLGSAANNASPSQ